MKKLLLLTMLTFSCAACPIDKPTINDGAAPANTCTAACANGRRLECQWAMPSDASPCVAVCQNAMDFGVKWDLRCMSTAETCWLIDICKK